MPCTIFRRGAKHKKRDCCDKGASATLLITNLVVLISGFLLKWGLKPKKMLHSYVVKFQYDECGGSKKVKNIFVFCLVD